MPSGRRSRKPKPKSDNTLAYVLLGVLVVATLAGIAYATREYVRKTRPAPKTSFTAPSPGSHPPRSAV